MKRFYLILLATLFSWQLFSQISIGDGTETDSYSGPIAPYSTYSYYQTIYKASDINASGNITSIQYRMADAEAIPSSDDNLDVWVGHTSKSNFTGYEDWISVSSLTQVLSDGSLNKTGDLVTITFTTPFNYNGTDNLVIAINAKESGYDAAGDAFYYSGDFFSENKVTLYKADEDNVIDANNPPSGVFSPLYPNITLMGIGQTCPYPSALATSNINATSAEINWTENGTATNWNIEYGPEGFIQGTGTSLPVTSNPYTLDNLTPATNYDVYVQSDCGSGDLSSWQGPLTFVTACPTVFNSNYTASLSVNPPTCWIEASGGSISEGPSTQGGSAWREGVGFTDANNYSVYSNTIAIYSNDKKEWLITPNFDLSGGAFELKTIVAYTAWSWSGTSSTPPEGGGMGNDDKVSVLISTDDGTSWTEIHSWTKANQPAPTGTEDIIDLSAYTGTVKFAIFATDGDVDDDGMNDFHLGHFEVRESSTTCSVPSNIMISDITTSAANISWTAPANAPANGYEYYYSTDNTQPTNTTAASGTTNTTTILLSGLEDATQYYVWVRSVCSDTEKSAWTNASDFTTISETGNYTVTFNVTDGTNPLENVSILVGGQFLHTNANGIATIELANDFYPYTAILAGYTEANGTFTVADENLTIDIVMPALSTNYTVTFNVTDGTNALENASILIDSQTLTTDNNGVATIDLTSGNYSYTVNLEGYEEKTGNVIVTNIEQTVNVTMIESTTLDCDNGFTVEYTDGFDNYEDLSSSCWTTLLENCSSPEVDIINNPSNNKVARLKQGGNQAGALYFISPKLTDLNDNKEISVKIKREYTNSFSCTFEIGIMTNATDVPTFQSISDISSNISNDFVEVSANTSAYTGGEGYVAFKYTLPTNDTYNNILLDDFRYAEYTGISSCDMPTNVSSSDVTETTANISWTAPENAPANGYKIKLYNSVTHQLTFTTTNNSSETLTGLSEGTSYTVYVRSICGEGNESGWTEGVNFTTAGGTATCDMPTNVVATNITGTTANISWNAPENAPANGYKVKLYHSVTHEVTFSTSMNTSITVSELDEATTYYVYVRSLCDENNESGWTNSINFTTTEGSATCDMPTNVVATNITETTANISWNAPENTPANGYKVKLYHSGTHAVTFSTSMNTSITISELDEATTYYVYVRSLCDENNESGWTNSINFTTTGGSVTCDIPTNVVATNITETTATISWNAPENGSASAYEYVYSTTNTAPATNGTMITETNVTLSDLSANTRYYVWVRSVCGDNEKSDWTSSINFKTVSVGVNSLDETTSFKYFPNPVKNLLKIDAQYDIQKVEIYNMNKAKVYDNAFNSTQIMINFNNLPSGTYLIRAIINNNVEHFKVIKL